MEVNMARVKIMKDNNVNNYEIVKIMIIVIIMIMINKM